MSAIYTHVLPPRNRRRYPLGVLPKLESVYVRVHWLPKLSYKMYPVTLCHAVPMLLVFCTMPACGSGDCLSAWFIRSIGHVVRKCVCHGCRHVIPNSPAIAPYCISTLLIIILVVCMTKVDLDCVVVPVPKVLVVMYLTR